MSSAQPGQIVVYREADNVLFGRVNEVLPDRVKCALWLVREGRWARNFSSIANDKIIAVLPEDTLPDMLDRQIRAFRKQRNAERRRINGLFEKRVAKFLRRRAA